jgi:mRNA-degrading endonuclease RelE of RelBE toxin-antitoxin system
MNFVWPESARSELRAIDREIAIRILDALTRYGDSGQGDIKALGGEWLGYSRLRVGDYRIKLPYRAASRQDRADALFSPQRPARSRSYGLGIAPTYIDEPIADRSTTQGRRCWGFGIYPARMSPGALSSLRPQAEVAEGGPPMKQFRVSPQIRIDTHALS